MLETNSRGSDGLYRSGSEVDRLKVLDRDYLEAEIAPWIEEDLQLHFPYQCAIVAFDDGEELIREILEDAKRSDHSQPTQSSFVTDIIRRLGERRMMGLMRSYVNGRVQFQSERTVANASLDSSSLPLELPEETELISIVPDNIQRVAEEEEMDYDTLEKYVVCHEAIHKAQASIMGTLDVMEYLKEKKGYESKPEEVAEEVKLINSVKEGYADFFTEKFMRAEGHLPPERNHSLRERFWFHFYGLADQLDEYEQGKEFIESLYEEGGIKMVNKALDEPPRSREELNNPQKYLGRLTAD